MFTYLQVTSDKLTFVLVTSDEKQITVYLDEPLEESHGTGIQIREYYNGDIFNAVTYAFIERYIGDDLGMKTI